PMLARRISWRLSRDASCTSLLAANRFRSLRGSCFPRRRWLDLTAASTSPCLAWAAITARGRSYASVLTRACNSRSQITVIHRLLRRGLAPLIAACALSLAPGFSHPGRAQGESVIQIRDLAFSPLTTTVNQGDTVVWANGEDIMPHNV